MKNEFDSLPGHSIMGSAIKGADDSGQLLCLTSNRISRSSIHLYSLEN